ncbi:hypothetical protein IEQ34_017866 [Dendrobium chrysotoxum]|uniref:Uncharacterized protein n=1 Tax=Dendrobium chrysotoxum TaxID=161865 RepID=A0AAV7GDA6_DENCH|nr:hypothetical protein IEQ34_017866 [Dendrobium chrysotoxum]
MVVKSKSVYNAIISRSLYSIFGVITYVPHWMIKKRLVASRVRYNIWGQQKRARNWRCGALRGMWWVEWDGAISEWENEGDERVSGVRDGVGVDGWGH